MPFADIMSQHDATHHLISQDKEQALVIYIQTSLFYNKKSKCHSFIFQIVLTNTQMYG